MKAAIAGCGAIAEVHAQCLSKLDGVELTAFADIRPERAESFAKRYIRYENGVPGCFYATTAYSADPKPIIELHCEKMTIRMEDPDVWLYDLDGKKEALPLARPDSYGKTYWGGGHAACIADFYHCLKQGERFLLNLETLNDTIRLMLACYESARLGKVFAV